MGEISEAIRFAGLETAERKIAPRDSADGIEIDRPSPRIAVFASHSAPQLPKRPRSAAEPQPLSQVADEYLPARICLINPESADAQNYRRLAFRIRSLAEERGIRSLVVTSALPKDGKTTIICNLAVELSRIDQSRGVALVDMDLRRPSVGKSLGIKPDVGIESLLIGEASVEECANQSEFANLDVFPARDSVRNTDFHLSSDLLKRCLSDLQSRYSLVLIDTPPLVVGSDASQILRYADAGVLVAAAARTASRTVRHVASQIPSKKLVATVLNFARPVFADAGYASYLSPDAAGDE